MVVEWYWGVWYWVFDLVEVGLDCIVVMFFEVVGLLVVGVLVWLLVKIFDV